MDSSPRHKNVVELLNHTRDPVLLNQMKSKMQPRDWFQLETYKFLPTKSKQQTNKKCDKSENEQRSFLEQKKHFFNFLKIILLTPASVVGANSVTIGQLEIILLAHLVIVTSYSIQFELVKFNAEITHSRVGRFNCVHTKCFRLVRPRIIG